jgi:hypothetical protein
MDHEDMVHVLASQKRNPQYAQKMMVNGQLIGSWVDAVIVYKRDGTKREESCEILFGWILDGKAIQDIWIAPARKDRIGADRDASKDILGTTVRVYDHKKDIRNCFRIEPNTQSYNLLMGSKIGNDIMNECRYEDNIIQQWCFTEITNASFRWIGRESTDEGQTW